MIERASAGSKMDLRAASSLGSSSSVAPRYRSTVARGNLRSFDVGELWYQIGRRDLECGGDSNHRLHSHAIDIAAFELPESLESTV